MDNFGQYNSPQNPPSPESFKLKWHKFLIYFALWAGALANAGSAVQCISGTVYGSESARVYTTYSGLRTVDMGWGLVLLALAAYMIYVRFQLAGFRIDAPRKLSILYGVNLGCSVVYLLAVSAATRLSLGSIMGDIAGTVFGSILMLFINQNYYNKRLELFVN